MGDSTWGPRDLSAAWDGEQIPPPSLGEMECGASLFYRGRSNGVHGEPESGKSWLCWITVAQILKAGGSALYVDYEDSEQGAAERLSALGVWRKTALSDRFGYIRPEEALGGGPNGARGEWTRLLEREWDCVIVDSINEAMVMEDLDPNSNHDAGVFTRRAIRPITESGTASILSDHVAKNRETRNSWQIGAQQKRAMIRGASYVVERKRPFGRGLEGEAHLYVAKDTPGAIRQRTGGDSHVARLILTSDHETGRIQYHLAAPPTPHALVLDKLRAYLTLHPGASKRSLRALSNSDLVDELIAKCVTDGRIEVEVTGTVHAHFWIEELI